MRLKCKQRIKSVKNPLIKTYSINDKEIYFDGIGDKNSKLG